MKKIYQTPDLTIEKISYEDIMVVSAGRLPNDFTAGDNDPFADIWGV